MPRKIAISPEDTRWLTAVHATASYADMARRLKCHPDTLRRILVRLGLQEFEGAKYALTPKTHVKMWTRACLGCGDRKPRPRNLYFCDCCRERLDT
ncbi:hypothetical protein [Poseidonocella sp. HB161398]|uniref:hypothetical protein n=1 Tax=Poseidonocella sp. HB161398 TaxID=2320855 RepID=UPI00110876F3|nr:hypothetical protein [Poseidonocella sp. HB161398]